MSRRSPEGVQYQGEVNEAMRPDGEGVLIQPDGSYHEGHWRNGLAHGWGRSVGADKWREDEGEWVAGQLHGRVRQRLRLDAARTATFEGEFEAGVRKRGTLRVSDGTVYAGEWTAKGALQCGKHVSRQPSHRTVMVGEWHEGGLFVGRITLLRSAREPAASTAPPEEPPVATAEAPSEQLHPGHHGQAPHQNAAEHDGHSQEHGHQASEEAESESPAPHEQLLEVAEGRFERGLLRRGRRAVSSAEGGELTFEGEFDAHGMLVEGTRTHAHPSGSVVEQGSFRDGFLVKGKQTMEGQGEAEGEWNPDTQVFVGTATSTAGTVEEGTFVQGKLAKGKRALADGRFWEGEWEVGPPGGTTRFKGHARAGSVEMTGQFEEDRLEGEGTVVDHATGRRIEGVWRNGDLVSGRVSHPDGRLEEGEFLRGKMVRGRIRPGGAPRGGPSSPPRAGDSTLQ